jgi:hypothetical protein
MDGREAEVIGNYIHGGFGDLVGILDETNRLLASLTDIVAWQRSMTDALYQIADSLERLAPRPNTTGVYVSAPSQSMSSPTIEATGSTTE